MTPLRQDFGGQVRHLIPLAELRRRLGVSVPWWAKHKRRLVREHGFPGPVPGFPHHYDSAAVEAWLDWHMPRHLRPLARASLQPAARGPASNSEPCAAPQVEDDWTRWLVERATAALPPDLVAGPEQGP